MTCVPATTNDLAGAVENGGMTLLAALAAALAAVAAPDAVPERLMSPLQVDSSAVGAAPWWSAPFKGDAGLDETARWFRGAATASFPAHEQR